MALDLRSIANGAIQGVNPDLSITIKQPSGYTVDPDTLVQVPNWVEQSALGNVQSMSSDDLTQVQALNIEGTMRAVYLRGNYNGIFRPGQQPNTVLRFTTNESGTVATRDWNVFKVLEVWSTWCKVAVVLQLPKETP